MYEVTVKNAETGETQTLTVDAESFTDAALAAAETPFCFWVTTS